MNRAFIAALGTVVYIGAQIRADIVAVREGYILAVALPEHDVVMAVRVIFGAFSRTFFFPAHHTKRPTNLVISADHAFVVAFTVVTCTAIGRAFKWVDARTVAQHLALVFVATCAAITLGDFSLSC